MLGTVRLAELMGLIEAMDGLRTDLAEEPLPDDDEGEGSTRVKNRQSSSCEASDGTFPAHMTHSDRFAGGLG